MYVCMNVCMYECMYVCMNVCVLLLSCSVSICAGGGPLVDPNLVWYAPGLFVPSFHLVVCVDVAQ